MTNELLAKIGLLEKENQELKFQLRGTTHCFDEEKHRELKKQLEVAEQQYNDLIEEKENLQEQLLISALQLEELKLSRGDYTQENVLEMKMTKLETQQKEFIKFLEGELLHARYYARDIAHYIEFVLRRYKEITQTKNAKSMK